jgi:hypothetical protein
MCRGFLGNNHRFGRIGVPSDMINQAGDQMIMQSLIAMGHKAE